MLIPVNKDLDSYKDDFFKGLTLKQTALSVISIAAGTGMFLLGTYVLKLSFAVSFYLALPVVLPIAATGFLRVHGMTPFTYLKRRRDVIRQDAYFFIPDFSPLGDENPEKGREKTVLYLDEGGREEAYHGNEEEYV